MNNKMTEVAKILGVELDEEFGIEDYDFRCKLAKEGLAFLDMYGHWRKSTTYLENLLTGKLKIKWVPKDGEEVWFVSTWSKKPYEEEFQRNFEGDILALKRGFIFRTEEEAIQDMKDRGWW